MKLDKRIKELYSLMEDILDYDRIKEFIKHDEDDIWSNDFGLTLWVRDNVLVDSNTICRDFIHSGITNKDEMSYELIDGFYWYLKTKEKNNILY